MRGISKYNHEGYYDPTAHVALTKVYREQLKEKRLRRKAGKDKCPNNEKEEKNHGKRD